MSFIRLGLAASLLVALAGCGAGGLGNVLGPIMGGSGSIQCDPGTQVQLADPQPGQTGVSPTIGRIVIVANGNSNNLYNTYNQWNLTLVDQYGNRINGGNLSLISFSGPQPYQSDFYYSSSIGQMPTGSTWNVQLSEPGATCLPVPLNSFST